MPDLTPIQPIAAIIGALISAAVSAAITYLVVAKRKRLAFRYLETWRAGEPPPAPPDSPPKVYPRDEVAEQQTWIAVKNVGNDVIREIAFEVELPGRNRSRKIRSVDDQLEESIVSQWVDSKNDERTRLHCQVPFMNPGEGFRVEIVWEGTGHDVKVYCRMEGVTVVQKRVRHWSEVVHMVSPPSFRRFRESIRDDIRRYREKKAMEERLSKRP